MILLVHMLFGALIGSIIQNPYLAIFLALLGHYFLDFFPHVEYSIFNIRDKNWSKSLPDFLKVFLDFLLGLFTIYLFSDGRAIVYLCGFVALIPDGLTLVNSLVENKALAFHQYIHSQKIHYFKYEKTRALNELSARPIIKNIIFNALVSLPFRILTQVAVAIISVAMLFYS